MIVQQKRLPKRQSKYPSNKESFLSKGKNFFSKSFFKDRRLKKLVIKTLKILIAFSAVSSVAYLFIMTKTFTISDVKFVGTGEFVNSTDVKAVAANNAFGKNIFLYSSQSLATTLKSSFLGAKDFAVTKVLPNTLVIHITQRVPIAVLDTPDLTKHFLVDDEGYVLGEITDKDYSDLPRLTYFEDLNVGVFINKSVVPKYMQLLAELKAAEVKISSISMYNDYTEFYTENGVQVLLPSEKVNKKYIFSIKAVISKALELGKVLQKIDLRYEKVIVLFNTEKL